MLTDEEQRIRAQKISSLYLTPLKRNTTATVMIEKLSLKATLSAAVFFSVPPILANTLYDFYYLGSFTTVADIQAGSILFIGMLMAVFGMFVLCLKTCFNILYKTYSSAGTIYWLSFIACFTLVPFLRVFTSEQDGQGVIELLTRASFFSLCCLILTSVIFILITKLTLKIVNQKK